MFGNHESEKEQAFDRRKCSVERRRAAYQGTAAEIIRVQARSQPHDVPIVFYVVRREAERDPESCLRIESGFAGSPERPRWVFFAVVLENAGCPITRDQLEALNKLPIGREGSGRMNEFLTEKQRTYIQ